MMTRNQLQNGKKLIHLMKRTHHKIKRRKQLQKIKVTNPIQAKITRNQNQQHGMKKKALHAHLQRRQQKQMTRRFTRWFTTVPCQNTMD